MRVRILRFIVTAKGGFNPGEVAIVPKKLGQAWCDDGLAEEEKSLDGPKETKDKTSEEEEEVEEEEIEEEEEEEESPKID